MPEPFGLYKCKYFAFILLCIWKTFRVLIVNSLGGQAG